MFKKAAFGTVGLLLLISPVLVSADDIQAKIAALLEQIKQLQAQIAQLQGQSSTSCVNLTSNMGPDDTDADTGGDVTRLQTFLASDSSIYPEGRITGYFGPATTRAVQRWQRAHGLVSSGDPDSTGYGFVGPRTRAAMACGGGTQPNISFTASPTSGTAPLAVTFLHGDIPTDNFLDFGDGSPMDTSGGRGGWSHTYYTPGTYTAKVSVCTLHVSEKSCDSSYVYGNVTITVTPDSMNSAVPTLISLPASGLSDGRLLRFKITAPQSYSYNIPQINLNIGPATATGEVSIYVYADSSFAIPVPGIGINGQFSDFPSITSPTGLSGSGIGMIPAGQTYYFEVRTPSGSAIANAPSMTTSLLGLGASFSVTNITQTRSNATSGGTITVAPGQQPANSLAPQGTIIPFTRFTLTNQGSSMVVVNSVTLQRTGNAGDGAFHAICLTNMNGENTHVCGNLNSNHQVTLAPIATLGAGSAFTIEVGAEMGTDLSAYAGQTAQLSLVGIGTSATVNGTLPITGATHTINSSLDACSSPSLYYTYGYKCWTMTGGGQQPTITSVSPTSASAGTTVTLYGSNFGAKGAYKIYFVDSGGTVRCILDEPRISYLTDTELHFNFTDSFTANCSGPYQIKYYNGVNFSNSVMFTVSGGLSVAPTVSVVSPNNGGTYTIGTSYGTGDFLPYSIHTVGIKTDGTFAAYLTDRNSANWKSGKYYLLNSSRGWQPGVQPIMEGSTQMANYFTPGTYYVLGTWQGDDGTNVSDFSDQPITLVSPGSTQQPTITATPTSIASGQSVKYNFTFPQNTNYAVFSISCNSAINTGSSNLCGTQINVLSNTDYTLPFYNTSSSAQQVTSSYCIGTSDGQYHPCVQGPTITVSGTAPQNVTFSASPTSGTAPLTVGFTGIATRPNFAADGQSRIDFGDGTSKNITNFADPPAGTSISALGPFAETHTYTTAGTFTATMTSAGGGTRTATITVSAAPEYGTLSVTPTSGTAPLSVTATFTVGSPCSAYTLTWGDGTNDSYTPASGTSCTQVVTTVTKTHSYTTVGSFTVSFQTGGSTTKTATVTVTASSGTTSNACTPRSDDLPYGIWASPTSGNAPLSVTFQYPLGASYAWDTIDFGDGTSNAGYPGTSNYKNGCVVHTYASAGTFIAQQMSQGTPIPFTQYHTKETITVTGS